MLLLTVACARRDAADFHGIKLGMTAEAVRTHFDEPVAFRTDGQAMTLTAPGRDVTSATFEFHRGILVAVRGTTVEAPWGLAGGARFSAGAVLEVTPAAPGFAFRWIARDCPAHEAEAETVRKNAKPW